MKKTKIGKNTSKNNVKKGKNGKKEKKNNFSEQIRENKK